ncbi:hypothetical protein MMC29_005150 [Sticta canariensis]|nr:hypothetical protein [Sticta canariensis]
MRLLFLSSSSVRRTWTNPFSSTSPKTHWNPGSATPYCFISTSPSDTLGDRTEFGANIAKVSNATPPDETPSSKTTSEVPENMAALTQWSPTATHVRSAEAGNSPVRKLLAARSRTQPRGIYIKRSVPSDISRVRLKARTKFVAALRRGQPRQLLFPLLIVRTIPGFIAALPDTAILQILRLLDPNVFIKPYKLLYEYNAPNMIEHLSRTCSIEWLFFRFKKAYLLIVECLFAHRKYLDFQKYEALLKFAQVTGDGPLGTQIWKDMLKDKVKPDVVFYNYYFEALCRPNPLFPKDPQQRLWDLSGLVAVKRSVSNMFTQMIAEGVMANTETFALLMTAYSRVGDLQSVKTILKNVWKIDVDAIIKTNKRSESLDVHPVSALHPTPDLLFAIAHIFGSDNNIAVAMRVIDHVSHRFCIPIDGRTWLELTHQTYINARQSLSHPRWRNMRRPKVPSKSLEVLGNIETFADIKIIGNTSPLMPPIQHRMIRMFYYRNARGSMLKAMVMFLLQYRDSYSAFIRGLKSAQARWFICAPETLLAFNSKTLPSHLELVRNRYMIALWVGLLLDARITGDTWQRRVIPDIVNVFWPYRDPYWGLDFRTSTGRGRLRKTNWHPVECQDFDLNGYLG